MTKAVTNTHSVISASHLTQSIFVARVLSSLRAPLIFDPCCRAAVGPAARRRANYTIRNGMKAWLSFRCDTIRLLLSCIYFGPLPI